MNKLYRYEIGYRNEYDDTRVILRELPVFREVDCTGNCRGTKN